MTHEANANREYQRRIMHADKTIETNLFGLSWPLRHRVVPNAATRRWCRDDGRAKALPAALNAMSRPLSVLGYFDAGALLRLQSPARPLFTPLAPVAGMPDSWVDRAALYAGETALRISEITSAEQAVKDLSPADALAPTDQRERKAVPVLGPDRLDHRGVQARVLAHQLQRLARRRTLGSSGLRRQDLAVTNDVVHHND